MRKVFGRRHEDAVELRRAGAGLAPLLLVTILLSTLSPAHAQGPDCATLRAEIDAPAPADATLRSWSDAARQQSYDLEQSRAYFDSIGCDDGLAAPDGDSAQCRALGARIRRMQAELDRLQNQLAQPRGDDRRALIEEYNAICRSAPVDAPRDDTLTPGDGDTPSIMDAPPSDREPNLPEAKVFCVRSCDGGWFPLAYKATPDRLDGLGKLCKALCPNAEAQIFTARPQDEIGKAVSVDGSPYTALPGAFRYQKVFDPACGCKQANQSWAEALAAAETMIDHGKNDVTVTPEISAAMARPIVKAASDAAKPATQAANPDRAASTTDPAAPTAPPPVKAAKRTKTARKSKPAPEPFDIPAMGDLPDVSPPATADGRSYGNGAPERDPGETIMHEIRPSVPTL